MAPLHLRNATSSSATASATLSLGKPGGTSSGDLLLAFVAPWGGFPSVTAPSGWSAYTMTTGTSSGLFVFYKVASASEPSTYFFALGSAVTSLGILAGYYGTAPLTAHLEAFQVASGASAAPSVATVHNSGVTDTVVWTAFDPSGQTVTWPSGFGAVSTIRSLAAASYNPGSIGTHTYTGSIPTAATWFAVAVVLSIASAPFAPTLTTPANGSYHTVASGQTFKAKYNSTDGANANAYAMRLKTSTSASYLYFNAGTGALQSTVVWNSCSVATAGTISASVPAAAISSGKRYQWSMAAQESIRNLQGPFASTFTLSTSSGPSLTVRGPFGTESSARPVVYFTATPSSGDTIIKYRVVVYTAAQRSITGFTPGTSPSTYDTGTVAGNVTQVTIGTTLTNQTAYYAYVQVTQTGTQKSNWLYSSFTVSFDAPAKPTITATATTTATTGCPMIQLACQCHTNLLTAVSASFETGVGKWIAGTDTQIASIIPTVQAPDGSYALGIQNTSTTTAATLNAFSGAGTSGSPVTASTEYTAMVKVLAQDVVRTTQLIIKWYNSAGVLISTHSAGSATDSGWTQLKGTVTSPSTAAFAVLLVTVASASNGLAAPGAPTVTPEGTAGSTHYTYKIVATNTYGSTIGGTTGGTTTGNATLSTTNYNKLTWTGVAGSTGYIVYRKVGTVFKKIGTASTTTFSDKGAAAATTQPPTTNTTGERHYIDTAGIFPGTVTTWTAGGFDGSTVLRVLRSDGFWVRGASTLHPATIPTANELVTLDDFEAVQTVAFTYHGIVVTPATGQHSGTGTASNQATISPSGWWELDPTTPSTATNAQPTAWNPQNTEQSAANQVLGQQYMNVVASAVMHQDFTATFEIFTATIYTKFTALLKSQKTLFVSSPWGALDTGYFRIGPQSGGLSTGIGNKTKTGQLLASTASAPHRTVQVTAVAQPRPVP